MVEPGAWILQAGEATHAQTTSAASPDQLAVASGASGLSSAWVASTRVSGTQQLQQRQHATLAFSRTLLDLWLLTTLPTGNPMQLSAQSKPVDSAMFRPTTRAHTQCPREAVAQVLQTDINLFEWSSRVQHLVRRRTGQGTSHVGFTKSMAIRPHASATLMTTHTLPHRIVILATFMRISAQIRSDAQKQRETCAAGLGARVHARATTTASQTSASAEHFMTHIFSLLHGLLVTLSPQAHTLLSPRTAADEVGQQHAGMKQVLAGRHLLIPHILAVLTSTNPI